MTAFTTLFWREILRIQRIWIQVFAPPLITSFLYITIFGKWVGNRLQFGEGMSYLQFILPGLIVLSVVTTSYSNVCFSFFAAKFHHYIEEVLVAPVSHHAVAWGYVLGGVVRGLVTGILVLLLEKALSNQFSLQHPAEAFLFLFLTSWLFSLAGFMGALFAESFDSVNFIPTFFLSPLTYLGGIFYDVNSLPLFWRQVAYCNPIYYIIRGFRNACLGIVGDTICSSSLILVGFCLAAHLWLLRMLKKRLVFHS